MYYDRTEAGQKLAFALQQYKGDQTIIMALPRGGVVVAAEVAKALDAPLELIIVRKIVHPDYPEYAVGSITDEGETIFEGTTPAINGRWLEKAESDAKNTIAYRKKFYYGNDIVPRSVRNKNVIIVDDGIATGLTMRAAVAALRKKRPTSIVVAVPVASQSGFNMIHRLVDEIVVLDNPKDFLGFVGAHYTHFDQVTDEEVYTILQEVEYAVHRKAT